MGRARERLAAVPHVRSKQLQEHLVSVVEAVPDLVAVATESGQLLFLNSAGRAMAGLAPEEPVWHLNLVDLFPERLRPGMANAVLPAVCADGMWSGEAAIQNGKSETPVSLVKLAQREPSGTVTFVAAVARDITERKQFEERLMRLADHDPLTGLYNRRRFQEELDRELDHSRRSGTRGAVLFLDLDGFKRVNDTMGHRAGDELLVLVGNQLHDRLRKTDTVARIGGDEFVILLPQTGQPEAEKVAAALLRLFDRPYVLGGGQAATVGASIGIALFPLHGNSAERLVSCADDAMYQAKRNGGRCCVYIPGRVRSAPGATDDRELWLREALQNEALLLYGQPILDLKISQIAQWELLARLRGQAGEVLGPDEFLGVAERAGLMAELDRYMVRQALHCLGTLGRDGRAVAITVNVSQEALADGTLADALERDIALMPSPGRLILEVSETAVMAGGESVRRAMEQIRGLGVHFSLHDFGTSFATFYHLKRLQVDYVKLDGTFTRNLVHDRVGQHLVQAMVETTRQSTLRTVAQFVSEEAAVDLVRSYGVDYAQGYFLGRPRPVADL